MSEHYDSVREDLGKVVREAWITWAQRQPHPKPSWLVPWDQLDEESKEADRVIGEEVTLYLCRKWIREPTWPARKPAEVFAKLIDWCRRFKDRVARVPLGQVSDFIDECTDELDEFEEELTRTHEELAQLRERG